MRGTSGIAFGLAFVAVACHGSAGPGDASDDLQITLGHDAMPDTPSDISVTSDAPAPDAPVDDAFDATVASDAMDAQPDTTPPDAPPAGPPLVYVGTGSGALTVYTLDTTTGRLTMTSRLATPMFPSFGAFDATHTHLYTTLEGSAHLASFAIDPATGALSSLGTVASTGMTPTFIGLDHTGRYALVADYDGGDVAVYAIGASGALAPATHGYPTGMLAHSIVTDPSNRFAFACNKGSDAISQFRFDATTGQLHANTPATVATAHGAGPRHIAFHPTLPRAYVIDELDCNVVVYSFNTTAGTLTAEQTLPTAASCGSGTTGAEIVVAPSGRFVYASTRGANTLTAFSVEAGTGRLAMVQQIASGGQTPRNFTIDPTGALLLVANQGSANVVAFSLDATTGRMTRLATNPVDTTPYWVGVLER